MGSYREKTRKRLAFEELESRDLLTSTPLFTGSQLDFLTAVIGSPPAEIGTPGTGFVLGLPVTSLARGDAALPGGAFAARPLGTNALPIGGSIESLSIGSGLGNGLGLATPQFDAFLGALESSAFASDAELSNALGGLAGLRPRISASAPLVSGGPNATEAVGQMTISTGANTVGMNATPISGFSSETGGTGRPATGAQSEESGKDTEPHGSGRAGGMNSSTGSVKTGESVLGGNNAPRQ